MKAPLAAVAALGMVAIAATMTSSQARGKGKAVQCRPCNAAYKSCMQKKDAQAEDCWSQQATCRHRCRNPLILRIREKMRNAVIAD